jgi:hypothetical protein
MISDIMYFSRLDWEEHCLNHLRPGQYYWECINNDPKPVSVALIGWTLIGVATGGLTFALGRNPRPKLPESSFCTYCAAIGVPRHAVADGSLAQTKHRQPVNDQYRSGIWCDGAGRKLGLITCLCGLASGPVLSHA